MTHSEAPLSVTLKPGTGYDAPLLTIRADRPEELQMMLTAIENNGVLDAVGRVAAMYAAKYEMGKQLGASSVGDPAPVAQQQPAYAAPAYVAPVAAPVAQAPYQPPVPGQPMATAVPAYVPPIAAAVPGVPEGPRVLGIPAKMVSSQPGATRAWRAWADPRPQEATAHISNDAKTDDPNHPGLAAGTHKFWAWIR